MNKKILIVFLLVLIVIVSIGVAAMTYRQGGVGFWKNQFDIAMGYKSGKISYSPEELQGFVNSINDPEIRTIKKASDVLALREGNEAVNRDQRKNFVAALNNIVDTLNAK